jgi:hypothetical protein
VDKTWENQARLQVFEGCEYLPLIIVWHISEDSGNNHLELFHLDSLSNRYCSREILSAIMELFFIVTMKGGITKRCHQLVSEAGNSVSLILWKSPSPLPPLPKFSYWASFRRDLIGMSTFDSNVSQQFMPAWPYLASHSHRNSNVGRVSSTSDEDWREWALLPQFLRLSRSSIWLPNLQI